MQAYGRILIIFGIGLVIFGVILTYMPKLLKLPRLPGDIFIQKESFTFYFPLATSIVVSIILSLILWLMSKR